MKTDGYYEPVLVDGIPKDLDKYISYQKTEDALTYDITCHHIANGKRRRYVQMLAGMIALRQTEQAGVMMEVDSIARQQGPVWRVKLRAVK